MAIATGMARPTEAIVRTGLAGRVPIHSCYGEILWAELDWLILEVSSTNELRSSGKPKLLCNRLPMMTSLNRSISESTSPLAQAPARVLVVLCTYNEIDNLPKMFTLIREHMPSADILVVDDSSPDGTSQWVEEEADRLLASGEANRIHLLLRPGKLGLGTALRDGIQWCLDQGEYDFLVNLDADVSHHPRYAVPMLQQAVESDKDVVVGTRYRQGGQSPGLPWHRKIISRCLNAYALRLLRLPISDCSGSYRCYRTSKLKELTLSKLRCPGYGFLEEILVALRNKDAAFGEVPIVFDCRYAGESKLSFSDALGAIKTIHRLALAPQS
ncbi:MAG: polyprenol monophosphomannose synthase [Planctomycetota bacterium]